MSIIIELLSRSMVASESLIAFNDRSVEVLLLCRDGKHNKSPSQPCIDRPSLTRSLLRSQLEQVRLPFQ
jgi:hypothetical protein